MRTGKPSARDTTSLLRLDSHQCGTQSGHTAIARSIATNGRTHQRGISAHQFASDWPRKATLTGSRPGREKADRLDDRPTASWWWRPYDAHRPALHAPR